MMPPRPSWYRGREAIGAFLSDWPLSGERRWRLVATRANGQLAFASYGTPEDGGALAHALQVLTLAPDGAIQDITSFLEPDERWIQRPAGISVRTGGTGRHAKGDQWQPRDTGPHDGF
jgi:hypothetical protein